MALCSKSGKSMVFDLVVVGVFVFAEDLERKLNVDEVLEAFADGGGLSTFVELSEPFMIWRDCCCGCCWDEGFFELSWIEVVVSVDSGMM
jgi:hypothetical protein